MDIGFHMGTMLFVAPTKSPYMGSIFLWFTKKWVLMSRIPEVPLSQLSLPSNPHATRALRLAAGSLYCMKTCSLKYE